MKKSRFSLSEFFFSEGRWLLICSAFAGLIAGISSTLLLAMITQAGAMQMSAWRPPMLAFISVLGMRLGASVVSRYLVARLGQRIVYELRMRISGMVQGAPLLNLEKLGTARILSAFAEDIPHISMLIMNLPALGINCVIILASLGYIAFLSIKLASFSLMLMVAGIVSYRLFMTGGIRSLLEARRIDNGLLDDFKALCEGIKELKLNRLRYRMFVKNGLMKKALASRRKNVHASIFFSLADAWGDLLLFLPLSLAIFLLPEVLGLPGELFRKYVITVIFLFGPITSLAGIMPIVGRASASIGNLRTVETCMGEEKASSSDHLAGMDADAPATRLELDGVTFQYPGQGFNLGPITFNLNPGELVYLVGGNGSGKSTLGKLLAGLYPVTAGRIRLSGVEISPQNLSWYRHHFAMIFSDCQVFLEVSSKPMGDDPETRDRVEWLLRSFWLDGKVAMVDGRFTEIRLSQGQRKRLAFISALVEDRQIYLLDEWAAEQDPPFRRIFYEEILPDLKRRGKMVLIITHDDKYFHLADRIIRLDFGRKAFEGEPSDLTGPSQPIMVERAGHSGKTV